MALSTSGSLLTGQLIKALGNTLIHSLWQGVLLAIAGGLIIVFTKKLSAALRYNLLICATLLFACGTIITFIMQLQPLQSVSAIYTGGNAAVNLPVTQNVAPLVNYAAKQSPADLLTGYLNAHCNTIVLIWFLIICIKSIKLAVGGYEVYHLKHSKIYAVSSYWDNRIAHLSAQLKIKQAVSLLESGIAKVPMVIGHLKPIILIPIGFINALSSDEVEAILVHELAHIRRRDYLVNLLQSFMEIVFFFNPAVIWISQLIKAERENCCDDIAIAHAGNKANYIQALLNCQEYQHTTPGLSMALATNKSTLLNRVKRIVNNHNQSLNIMEKTLLTTCLVTGGLFIAAFSTTDTIKKSGSKINQVKQQAISVDPKVVVKVKVDTKVDMGKVDTTLNFHDKVYKPAEVADGTTIRMAKSKNGKAYDVFLVKRGGEMYQLYIDHSKVTRLYVNGEAAPVSQYKSKVDELLREYKKLEKYPVPPVPPVPPTGEVKIKEPETLGVLASPAAPSPKVTRAVVPAVQASPPPAVAEMSEPPVPAAPTPPAPLAMVRALPVVAPMAPLPPVKPAASFTEATDELIKAGIIKDKNNFDFNISNDALKVDGVKQPEAVHQQILKKFVKKQGDKINWHYSNHN